MVRWQGMVAAEGDRHRALAVPKVTIGQVGGKG